MKGGSGLTRLVALGCGCAAVLALLAAGLAGSWSAGIALAIGLALGAVNGALISRSIHSGVGFRTTSLGRLGLLSVVGLGVGFLLVPGQAWLVAVGLGAAQLILVAVSARELVRA